MSADESVRSLTPDERDALDAVGEATAGRDAQSAYVLLISSIPSLYRSWRDSPNDTARRLNAILHDAVVAWCIEYQELTGRGNQGLTRVAPFEASARPCPACGAALAPSETHWSLFPEPMGGYVCPVMT